MSFFEERKAKSARKRRRLRRDEEGRPTLVLPAYLPEDVVLAVSGEAAVVMHGIACYPGRIRLLAPVDDALRGR